VRSTVNSDRQTFDDYGASDLVALQYDERPSATGGTVLALAPGRTTVGLMSVLVRRAPPPIEVAPSVESVLAQAEKTKPRLILIDLSMGEQLAIDLVRTLRRMSFCGVILVFAPSNGRSGFLTILRAGADGSLLEDEIAVRLPNAIDEVSKGGAFLSPAAAKMLLGELTPDQTRIQVPVLTARERQVLHLLSTGGGYAEIARELAIGLNTVRTHVRSLYDKLGVENRAEAVNLGWFLGLLQRDG
jgi:DNA-binding NarL/FixJ family response regulator